MKAKTRPAEIRVNEIARLERITAGESATTPVEAGRLRPV